MTGWPDPNHDAPMHGIILALTITLLLALTTLLTIALFTYHP